jgi:hypothetical protein
MFGWQGIEINAPQNWDLTKYSGNLESGYATLDDGKQVRLQVQWETDTKKNFSFENSLSLYELNLGLRFDHPVEFQSGLNRATGGGVSTRGDLEIVPFSWKSLQCGYGIAWRCRKCRRTGVAEILYPLNDANPHDAGALLSTLTDHRADSSRLWHVYGFGYLAPATFLLEMADFSPGRIRFSFRGERRSWLKVERWAMASQTLKDTPLEEWPGELMVMMGVGSKNSVRQTPMEIQGHPAFRFTQDINRSGLYRRWEQVSGVVWHCPGDDKVFAVASGTDDHDLIGSVVSTIRCAPA